MQPGFKITVWILAALYPFLIFAGMQFFGLRPRVLVLILAIVSLLYFISHTDERRKGGMPRLRFYAMLLASLILIILTVITQKPEFVKLYPVIMNLFLLISFSYTLVKPPAMIFRFALLKDPGLAESPERGKAERYCRGVTFIWLVFFLINGSIALLTALFFSNWIWSLYNGMISYLCMGLIFVIEFIVRKRKMKS